MKRRWKNPTNHRKLFLLLLIYKTQCCFLSGKDFFCPSFKNSCIVCKKQWVQEGGDRDIIHLTMLYRSSFSEMCLKCVINPMRELHSSGLIKFLDLFMWAAYPQAKDKNEQWLSDQFVLCQVNLGLESQQLGLSFSKFFVF